MTVEALIAALRTGDSPHAEKIAVGLTDGGMKLETIVPDADIAPLRRTFRVRREHLAGIDSQHARDLHRDVSVLCDRLESVGDSRCMALAVRTAQPGESYLVWLESSGRLLGCFHTFSKLELTPEDWERLWGRSDES